MTRDDIIRLAREAGLKEAGDYDYRGGYEQMPLLERQALDKVLCFAALMAAAEREACAKIIEAHQVPVGNSAAGELAAEWTMDALREIRAAIRSRNQPGAEQ